VNVSKETPVPDRFGPAWVFFQYQTFGGKPRRPLFLSATLDLDVFYCTISIRKNLTTFEDLKNRTTRKRAKNHRFLMVFGSFCIFKSRDKWIPSTQTARLSDHKQAQEKKFYHGDFSCTFA